MASAIGIDVGGTKIAAGLLSLPDGKILARGLWPTRPQRGGPAVLAEVIAIARSLIEQSQQCGQVATSIGVGVAELVGKEGDILSEATIHWKGLNAAHRIYDQTGLPTVIEADVRAAALAEAVAGAGRAFQSFLYVTIGTGISCCLVIDRMPYAGARGLTGTFASSSSVAITDRGELIGSPPLEGFAAGPAMARRLSAVRSGFDGDAGRVLALAELGDPVAKEIVVSAATALGAAMAHLVNTLDPEAIVIGGGLGLACGLYRDRLVDAVRQWIYSDCHRDLPIQSASLAADAGWIGAAFYAPQAHPAPHD